MSASAILKLQAAGFSAEQVSALAELIDTQAATKSDLEAVEHRLGVRIDAVEHKLETKIDEIDRKLDAKIEAIDRKLDAKIDAIDRKLDAKIDAIDRKLDAKIDNAEHRLETRISKIEADVHVLKWMLGFVLAFQVAIFAKLFLH